MGATNQRVVHLARTQVLQNMRLNFSHRRFVVVQRVVQRHLTNPRHPELFHLEGQCPEFDCVLDELGEIFFLGGLTLRSNGRAVCGAKFPSRKQLIIHQRMTKGGGHGQLQYAEVANVSKQCPW